MSGRQINQMSCCPVGFQLVFDGPFLVAHTKLNWNSTHTTHTRPHLGTNLHSNLAAATAVAAKPPPPLVIRMQMVPFQMEQVDRLWA